jgi:hypothetical protein
MNTPTFTLDDLNKKLIQLRKSQGFKSPPEHYRILVGKKEAEYIDNSTYSVSYVKGYTPTEQEILEQLPHKRKKFFQIPVVRIEEESYFEVVYCAEEK